MALVTLGINHRTAPVELRERVAFTPERMAEAFAELRATSGASEAAILSTCNRTELYLAGDDDCARRCCVGWRGSTIWSPETWKTSFMCIGTLRPCVTS